MAVQRQIKINRDGDRVVYDPAVLNADPRDQIFWTNNDTEAHWPGLADANGNLINQTFFMPNQIAPRSSSSIFSPSGDDTFYYVCSLHEGEGGGKIVVGTPKKSAFGGQTYSG